MRSLRTDRRLSSPLASLLLSAFVLLAPGCHDAEAPGVEPTVQALVALPAPPVSAARLPIAGTLAAAPDATQARLIVKLRDPVARARAAATQPATASIDLAAAAAAEPGISSLVQKFGVQRAAPLFPGRMRQMARTGLTDAQIAAQVRARFPARAARVPRNTPLPDLGGRYVLDLQARSRAGLSQTIAALRADPSVLEVEEDKVVHVSYVPNDPSYASTGSWGQPYDDLYGLKKIGTTAAWDTARGTGVVVAVVDTGVDRNHPDIDGNMWTNPGEIPGNGLDDDGNGLVDDALGWDFVGPSAQTPVPDNDPIDVLGHGTHVAGTIAAEGDNHLGVVGVAWKAHVMAVRALDDNGAGPDSSLANAILYAVDEGADVINASWGGSGLSSTIQAAVDYAHAHGVVFVAAAGNSNQDASGFYPAAFPPVITVAAVDPFDNKASFSNFGNKIDVAAPGVDILSLQAGTTGYVRLDGTSMAAPHVSGVAALILQLHPSFTVEQVRQVLRSSATDLGVAGKDPTFGYGRVNAAGAVLVANAPGAKILSPADGTAIQAPVAITGTASGGTFTHYVVEFGSGDSPTSFTTIVDSPTPVTEGALATWDPSAQPDGLYTVRLRVLDSAGKTFSDQIQIQVRYLALFSPATASLPPFTSTFKPGTTVDITGRAMGPSFQSYVLEWAPGAGATSGFSSTGITLVGGGLAPVTNGLLGHWTTPTAAAAGLYTLRLTVANNGFSSTIMAPVYLEPDLVSGGWPAPFDDDGTSYSPVPGRRADGQTRLLFCGWLSPSGTSCHSFAPDGSSTAVALQSGSHYPPSVGNLDGQPGDEVVAPDGQMLRIFSADLAPVRTIVDPQSELFGIDTTNLADLDNDGTPEIIALARGVSGGFIMQTGTLHVYRADGQPYSSRYPIAITSPTNPAGFQGVAAVAADVDGDGKKEILVAVLDLSSTQFSVLAYNADGTPHTPWSSAPFATSGFSRPVAADLDHDGRDELVIAEYLANGSIDLRVIDGTGITRPGWPVAVPGGSLAIGDLDRDGREEIVAAGFQSLRTLHDDGTTFGSGPWTIDGTPSYPSIADVDGDGAPDVVVCDTRFIQTPIPYYDARLRVFNRQGVVVKTWQLYGTSTEQAICGGTAIGDFTGDGKTDIAVNLSRVAGGGVIGTDNDGILDLLTTGAPFDPRNADWPMDFHDPGNSGERPVPVNPTVQASALADAFVRDGSNAGTNSGTATTLAVKTTSDTGNNRVSYLRFSLTGAGSGPISSARLRLFGSRPVTSTATLSAYGVASTTWSETGINWNNRPALADKQATAVVVTTTARYYEWDVSAWVQKQRAAGATAVSLAVKMDQQVNDSPDTFNAREATSNPPVLVLGVAADAPPTVASPAAAQPSPAIGISTTLSVLGQDDGGEAALTYTWATSGTPPAPVTFAPNGSNAAKSSQATFTKSGTYGLSVTIRDARGQTAVSTVTVQVSPTPTTVAVTPATATVATGGTQPFTAAVLDQFGGAVTPAPAITWSVTGGGTISASGLFTAGANAGGPFTVRATSGTVSGTAAVTVSGGSATVTLAPAADAYVRDGSASAGANFGKDTTLPVKTTSAAGNNRISYLRFALTGVSATVSAATLRLYGSRATASSATVSAFGVSSTTWSETTITWNNRPALDSVRQGTALVVGTTAQYREWDVTAWLKAQKAAGATAVSLAVRMDTQTNDSPDTFNAREATANPPQLVVTSGP